MIHRLSKSISSGLGKLLFTSFLIGLTLFSFEVLSQSKAFEVFWGDDYVGSMDVSRKLDGEKVEYEFFVDVRFKVIWKYHRTTRVKAVYEQDTMIYSSYLAIMNDDIKDWRYLERKGNGYKGFNHPSDSLKINHLVNFSSAKLYYQEPEEGLEQIFAEGYTQLCNLKNLGNHQYRLYLPGGKENVYTYENQELAEVLVERTWFTLTFKRLSP